MILLCVAFANALTLQQAVDRAAEVDPSALTAALQARQARLSAAESWVQLGVSPSLSASRTLVGGGAVGGATVDSARFTMTSDALDPSAWFDATQLSAQARAARWVASGAELDAQYAVALLYFGVRSAEAALAAAEAGEIAANGTLSAVRARVAAGLDSELTGKRAEAAALLARSVSLTATSDVEVSRLQLARALQQESVDALAAPPALSLPGLVSESPYLASAAAELDAARLDHAKDIAGLFPSGSVSAGTPLDPLDWSVTVGATWTLDGVAGPLLRERVSALEIEVAQTQLDAVQRDLALGIAVATSQAKAAQSVAEAAAARESLAEESLKVGQLRLSAGLASGLEVLLLQEDLAEARADRVASEFAASTAVLEARRMAGVRWEQRSE